MNEWPSMCPYDTPVVPGDNRINSVNRLTVQDC